MALKKGIGIYNDDDDGNYNNNNNILIKQFNFIPLHFELFYLYL